MQRDNRWLNQVMSVEEGTPYHGNLTARAQPSDDNATSVEETLNVVGITVFQMENGILHFKFFVDDNRLNDPFSLLAAENVRLRIPTRDFDHPVEIYGEDPNDGITLHGYLNPEFFGEEDAPLSRITIQLTGLPQKWRGSDNLRYYEALGPQDWIQKDGTTIIPNRRVRWTVMSGFTLQANGWTARLTEIPTTQRTDPSITHVCNLTIENRPLTGATAQEFVDDNLFPFLSFVFGQHARFHTIVGYKGGVELWVRTSPQRKTPLSTRQDNWFLRTWYEPTDLSPLFQQFYGLDPYVKKHWGKVIYQYAKSEEIMGTLQDSALAASVSFAALEGLARSIISTYSCKDEWLKNDLSLKTGKGIKDAIEMVAKREFGEHSRIFREASEQIYTVRNATFHTDLTSDEDPINAYYRWNASQALVEIILLSQMGMKKIPNRTAHGTFNVMGKDMYADMRKEELAFE